jgi:hypothetical protein
VPVYHDRLVDVTLAFLEAPDLVESDDKEREEAYREVQLFAEGDNLSRGFDLVDLLDRLPMNREARVDNVHVVQLDEDDCTFRESLKTDIS